MKFNLISIQRTRGWRVESGNMITGDCLSHTTIFLSFLPVFLFVFLVSSSTRLSLLNWRKGKIEHYCLGFLNVQRISISTEFLSLVKTKLQVRTCRGVMFATWTWNCGTVEHKNFVLSSLRHFLSDHCRRAGCSQANKNKLKISETKDHMWSIHGAVYIIQNSELVRIQFVQLQLHWLWIRISKNISMCMAGKGQTIEK